MDTKEMTGSVQGITARKLVIRDFAEVMRRLGDLPKRLEGIDTDTTDGFLKALPTLIADSLPELASIIALATDADEEQVMDLDLADFTALVASILEVNRYEEIMAFLGKIKQSLSPKAA